MIDLTRYMRMPYTEGGRSFEGADCWGLVYLVFKHELDIELPDPGLVDFVPEDLMQRFSVVEDPTEYDIFLITRKPYRLHVGVMIGPGVLHIGYNGAVYEAPGRLPGWKTAKWYRYKAFDS